MVPAQPPRPLPAKAGDTTPQQPWPVRLLTAKLTDYIAKAPGVWVEGQVVQLVRRPGQPTCYLTLRDTDVDLSFQVTVHARVLDGLPGPLADGAHVVVHARPQLYPRRGSLSLAADDLRPVGVGELLARLEHLRRMLAAEGLFAAERKRPLPFLPRRVGLVCGRASAAERDVVENARRRWPAVAFDIRAVAVQGVRAVPDVVAAVQALDAEPLVDVIVIARGGGSLEDLLPFSNETMVRAVAACRTPVVSAIGHEVDNPLLDLVADVRASTPTDAAKRIVPDVAEELTGLTRARSRASAALYARLDRESHALAALRLRPALADPYRMLAGHAEVVTGLTARARQAICSRLDRAADDIRHLAERVEALSPAATLARGYAVVQTTDGSVVRDPACVPDGSPLRLRLAAGDLGATATGPWAPPGNAAAGGNAAEATGEQAPAATRKATAAKRSPAAKKTSPAKRTSPADTATRRTSAATSPAATATAEPATARTRTRTRKVTP
ncbi:MAG TPA: exodeoxyribonuclease VII large subunit [Kineosporiaceae bacterium]|nr:exodeoxyribonuclease VII large subunit [Kineosporiaceae bacterium]